ncbi:MAG: exodeoxyribonuclease VII large subunit [Jatrophihabitantaceae bacterium]
MPPANTSAESPWPVRVVAQKIGEWVARLGEVWVDGQIAQLTRRPGMPTQFLTLRDPDANISVSVTCARTVLGDDVVEGSRVIVRARPDFWIERGTLSLRATEIRQVGLGELLARLEQLRKLLAAEGLFAPGRRRALPFLPRKVGLITGRASAAERDVVENARRRLPRVEFVIENVATQGPTAVTEVVDALERLDADPDVDVIVIARGGGSVEDLLPFSNETLIRAVSDARTPVVSAIGHESDVPLLDHVADLAASTPTDAAKRIVPDLAEEQRAIADLRRRARDCVHRRLDREAELMFGLPQRMRGTIGARIERERLETAQLRDRSRRRLAGLLETAKGELVHVRARVRSLSPQATLDRGYAVVRRPDGTVVRDAADAAGSLRIRVARGEFDAVVSGR